MAQIVKELVRGYVYLFEEQTNPLVKDWFLMSSPWPGLALLGLYIWFIKDYGPKMMMNREPYKIDRIIQIYNLIQIFLSGYTFYKFMKHAWWGRYSWRCEPTIFELDDPEDYMVATMMHVYFVTKVVDLLDTVFFVLRKKYNQITFLHLYHHAGMVALSWGGLKWYSTGPASMLETVNSLVHTVMYGYYFLTSVAPEYKNNIWWKKYITKLQLAQFLFLMIFYCQLIIYNPCKFPAIGLAILIPQNTFMFILFSDFYYKAYLKKKPVKAS